MQFSVGSLRLVCYPSLPTPPDRRMSRAGFLPFALLPHLHAALSDRSPSTLARGRVSSQVQVMDPANITNTEGPHLQTLAGGSLRSQPKVNELDVVVPIQQDVLQLHIAVDDLQVDTCS